LAELAGRGGFPETRHSVVRGVASEDVAVRGRAWNALVESYWRPVYKYARLKWRLQREDAEDLTQAFFARALEKAFFDRYDPARARFRTFLRTCLDGFAANEWKAAHRKKRGGDAPLLSLDFLTAEGELREVELKDERDVEDYFHKEWVRSLFSLSLEALRRQCQLSGKRTQFALFERYDIDAPSSGQRPSYEELAREHGLPVTQVTNYLAWARREFRRIVLEKLRELTASEEEFRAEAREILGADPQR
jgi:RNA polymerase sigma factor (sigma-70 family)